MTQVAKLARELRAGNILAPDVLPARIIHEITANGDFVVIQSRAVQLQESGVEPGIYTETVERERLVTIEVV